MAEKKAKVKAHRGFIHVRPRRSRLSGKVVDSLPKKRLTKIAKKQKQVKQPSSKQIEKMKKAFQKRVLKQAKSKTASTERTKQMAERALAQRKKRISKNPNMTAAQKQAMMKRQAGFKKLPRFRELFVKATNRKKT